MESTVALLQSAFADGLPLDSINAVANTITAAAVLWAARILRRSITDIRLLHLQPPLSGLLRLEEDMRNLDDQEPPAEGGGPRR